MGWVPATGRPDPVGLLEEQNGTREADWSGKEAREVAAARKGLEKARTRDSLQALSKLAEMEATASVLKAASLFDQ
jgi:hypothetical protein